LSLATAFLINSLAAGSATLADTVLITGANVGIGLEFVKQYAGMGWKVIATHRRSEIPESLSAVIAEHTTVSVERMDVSNIGQVEALAAKLKDVPIDVLINNAGVYSDRSGCEDEECGGRADTQVFGNLDYELFNTIMTVNVAGALLVSEKFIDNVRASGQKKLVSMSSTNGSLTEPLPGSRGIFYRASKAALNRAMQLVAVNEDEQGEGVIVLLLHPGTVSTERLGFRGLPEEIAMTPSVAGMIEQIEKATIADSGRFIQFDGATMPW
jgi:NAD(P)-dependent dehydrogenase (short-subunit alcohol dehydrogenase family)